MSVVEPAQFHKYQLLRRIAVGGMAEIFLARIVGERGFAKKAALKRILPQYNSDPRFVEMFVDEALIAARLNHPNVAQVYDFGDVGGVYFIAMEWVDGLDLRELLNLAQAAHRPLSPQEVAAIGEGICSGLSYAHNLCDDAKRPLNIVHRDISPHNIMLSRAGAVKIMDFGIAKAEERSTRTQSGHVKGKMAYMAPEQVRGEQLDKRCDQFAVGLVLWECLTGRRLYQGDSDFTLVSKVAAGETTAPSALRPDLPGELEAIIMRALQRDPAARYPDLADMEKALAAFRFARGAAGAVRLAELVEELVPTGTAEFELASSSPAPWPATKSVAGASTRGDGWGVSSELSATLGPTVLSGPSALVAEAGPDAATELAPVPVSTSQRPRASWLALGAGCVLALSAVASWVFAPASSSSQGPREVVLHEIDLPTQQATEDTRQQPLGGAAQVGTVEPGMDAASADTAMAEPRVPERRPGASAGGAAQPGAALAAGSTSAPGSAPGAASARASAAGADASSSARDAARPSARASAPRSARGAGPGSAAGHTSAPGSAPASTSAAPAPASPKPTAAPGFVSLRTLGGSAEVYLGERKLGDTPLFKVELPAGTHRLRLLNKARAYDQTVVLEVLSGEHTKKNLPME